MVPMARIASVAILFVASGHVPALACNADLLSFQSWNIEPIDATNNRITTVFRSNALKPIRMIDASASYKDALGKVVGTFALERDISLTPGGEYTETKVWGPYTFERLLKLRPDEVETAVCVRAVLYDDGTKETF